MIGPVIFLSFAAFGMILIPAMVNVGYPPSFSAAAGTTDIVFRRQSRL